jgi:hypothetical protein
VTEFQVLVLLAVAVLVVVALGLLWLRGSVDAALSRRLSELEGSREAQGERLERELRAAIDSSASQLRMETGHRLTEMQTALVAQVARHQQAATAGALDCGLGLHRIRLLLGQVANRHVGAFAREQHCDRATDPGVAARDDRRQSVELAGGLVALGLVARPGVELGLEARRVLVLLRERRLRFLEGCLDHVGVMQLALLRHGVSSRWIRVPSKSGARRAVQLDPATSGRRVATELEPLPWTGKRGTRSRTQPAWLRIQSAVWKNA